MQEYDVTYDLSSTALKTGIFTIKKLKFAPLKSVFYLLEVFEYSLKICV